MEVNRRRPYLEACVVWLAALMFSVTVWLSLGMLVGWVAGRLLHE